MLQISAFKKKNTNFGSYRGWYVKIQIMKAPKHLNESQKKQFDRLVKMLRNAGLLAEKYQHSIELLAINFAQFQWAINEINRKNGEKMGAGYKQTFESGAENISVEMSIKRDAEKSITPLLRQFGLDPKSEKDIKSIIEDGSEDAFENFRLKKVENK